MLSDLIEVVNLSKMCGISNEVFTMFLKKTIEYNKNSELRLSDEENVLLMKKAILSLEDYNSEKTDITKEFNLMEKSNEIKTRAEEIIKILKNTRDSISVSLEDLFKMTKINFNAKNITEDDIDKIVANVFNDYVTSKCNTK